MFKSPFSNHSHKIPMRFHQIQPLPWIHRTSLTKASQRSSMRAESLAFCSKHSLMLPPTCRGHARSRAWEDAGYIMKTSKEWGFHREKWWTILISTKNLDLWDLWVNYVSKVGSISNNSWIKMIWFLGGAPFARNKWGFTPSELAWLRLICWVYGRYQILMESIHSGNMYTLRQFVTWLLKMVHL